MNKFAILVLLVLLMSAPALYGNNCLLFDGTNDYITLDDQLSLSGAYTIEAWFNSYTAGEQTILAATLNGQHGLIIGLENSNRYRFLHRDPTGAAGERNLVVRTGDSFVNSWHHIAAVFDGGNTHIYLDGSEIASMAGATSFSTTFDITLGQLMPNNPVRHFNGMLDEVRIWNTVRTQADIQNWMNNELAGDETGLLAYYQFNQSSGAVLEDTTVNGNNGTLRDFTLPAAWVASSAPISFHPQDPPPGNYLDFDGVDDYVEIPDADVLHLTDEMTIETWVRFNEIPHASQCLFAKSAYDASAYSLVLEPDSLVSFHMGSSGLSYQWADLTVDAWNHLAVTCDADSMRIYINGIEKAACLAAPMTASEDPLLMGKSAGTAPERLFGGLDEFRVWNVARTQQQIEDNRHSLLPANTTGLVAYYRFDQGDAGQNNAGLPRQLVDHTNTLHGAINNFALIGDSSNWLASGSDTAIILSTIGVHSITGTTADVTGEIYCTGEPGVTVRGVCYSASNENPTTDDNTVEEMNPGGFSAGSFTESLFGLSGNIPYFARAYAINAQETVYGETLQFITGMSPDAPDRQACGIVISIVDQTQIDVNWTNGNGDFRAVFMTQGESGRAAPVDNTTYFASSVFGLGDEISDTGWYCIYNGADSSVTVTGLVENTSYRVMVCEYNQSSGSELYNFETAAHNPANTTIELFSITFNPYDPTISGKVAWGDYDNDGDLDILVTGGFTNGGKIFRNDGGTFTNIGANLTQVGVGAVAWGDYDNDGDLDILVTGEADFNVYISEVYRNDDGFFTNINAGLAGVIRSSVAWGDYDNDGDLDILLTGKCNTRNSICQIYRNDNGIFTDIDAGLPNLESGDAVWGDYDNDGDLDILLTGQSSSDGRISRIYRNDNGVFTDINAGLAGVTESCAAWGDYDNDGDLDVLLSGSNDHNEIVSSIYRNINGVFFNVNAGLSGASSSELAWGDYDNDGDLDILMTRLVQASFSCVIYRNDDGVFSEIVSGLQGLLFSRGLAWGDYDNDGDLDILMAGDLQSNEPAMVVITNNMGTNAFTSNTAPTAPTNLQTSVAGDLLAMSWDAASDAETPAAGITYNLQVGYGSDGVDIASPMAQSSDGWRMIPAMGGQNHNTQWTLSIPWRYQTPYVIRVQAIDSGFMGSPFSQESTLLHYPQLMNAEELGSDGVLAWEMQLNIADVIGGYQVQIDDDPSFAYPVVDDVVSLDERCNVALHSPGFAANAPATMMRKQMERLPGDSAAERDRPMYFGVQLSQLADYGDLQDDTVYYWRMKPIYTDSSVSVFSIEEKSFAYNTANNAPNPPIDGFSPANDDPVASQSPMISWNAATDPDASDYADLLRYVVQLDTLDAFATPALADTTAMGVTFVQLLAPLESGYRYYYRIKTIDDDDAESVWSATQQFVTLMPPQNVTISADCASGVTLAWDAMHFASRNLVFTVYSSNDPDAAFPGDWDVEAVNLSTTSWRDPDVTSLVKYYRVTVGGAARDATQQMNMESMR